MIRYILAIILGVIMGVLCARYILVSSAWSLAPWTIAALAFGWWSHGRKEAAGVGAVFGFFLSYSFMVAGYSGSATVYSRLIPFVLFGVFGALCGSLLAFIVQSAKVKLGK